MCIRDRNKDIDMTISAGGEHLAIPVGYTEKITLDKIIELDEGEDVYKRQPAYVNISELFRSLSPLKPGDPIRLVCELYKVFREETHSEEPLDCLLYTSRCV